MKIQRVNDSQMKFFLQGDDLAQRNIKVRELTHNSDKTRQLFREIMNIVQEEDSFASQQMLFEARPSLAGDECLVVTVTKLEEAECGGHQFDCPYVNPCDHEFNLTPTAKEENRFKRAGLLTHDEPDDEEMNSYSLFSFADLDTAAMAAAQLTFAGPSRLLSYDDRYYLWLQNETQNDVTTIKLEVPLHELGQKHIANDLSRTYLLERGETIIAEGAVEKLRMYYES